MKKNSRKDLTVSQEKVFETVKRFIETNGFPPTSREIGEQLSISSTSVFEQLDRLEKKGFIKRHKKSARSIEILKVSSTKDSSDEKISLIKIPVIGTIAAGSPVFAFENIENEILVDESSIGKGKFFALRIKGDSMINAGINNGDLVIIRRQPLAENGEIVAALINDEATIKRLKMEKGHVFLLPENPAYEPIEVTYREDFRILGKLVTTVYAG